MPELSQIEFIILKALKEAQAGLNVMTIASPYRSSIGTQNFNEAARQLKSKGLVESGDLSTYLRLTSIGLEVANNL